MSRARPKKLKQKELLRAIIRNDESQIVHLAASRPGLDALQIGGAIVSYHRMRQDPRGQNITPLLVAVHFGELELCKYLIQEEVDVNAGYLHGLKPLSLALDYKHYEIAKLLMDSGADVNLPNENGETAMEYAINAYSSVKIVKDLLAAGVDKDAIINRTNKFRAITQAVSCNNVSVVTYLLNKSVDVDVIDTKGITPMALASLLNFSKIAEILLKNGAKVDGLGKSDIPPVCLALLHMDGKVLKILVKAGANVNLVVYPSKYKIDLLNGDGHLSTLHLAVANLNFEGVKILLENGADVNSTEEEDGMTPLQIIIQRQETDFTDSQRERYRKSVQILLESGADLNVTIGGLTMLQYAVEEKKWIAVEEMIKYGINVNTPLKVHFSTFHYVLLNDKFELTKLCLEFGADVLSFVDTPHGSLPPIEIVMMKGSLRLQRLVARHIFSGSDYPLRQNRHRLTFETFFLKEDFALSRAIQTNKFLLAKFSLEGGAKITNGHVFDLKHALHHPIVKKNYELVTLLLLHGVHLHIPYADQSTYLHLAVRFCLFKVVRVLLDHGACYNYKDIHGITPAQIKVGEVQEGEQFLGINEGLGFMKYISDAMLEERLKYIYQKMQEEEVSSTSDDYSDSNDETEEDYQNSAQTEESTDTRQTQQFRPKVQSSTIQNKNETPQTEERNLFSKYSSEDKLVPNESHRLNSKSSKRVFNHETESKKLLKDITRMFSMVRRGDAKVLKILEARRKSEVFRSYLNCVNRKGNTLMSEALSLGFCSIAEGLMKLRLEID